MSDLESPVWKKEEHLSSLISEVMKNGFANFLDRLKDDDYPETFKLDEIATLEKMEEKLKKKKEDLQSRMDSNNRYFWVMKLVLLALLMVIFYLIVGYMRESSNGYFFNGDRFWLKLSLIVDAVILILLLVFTIVDEIINQITDWKRRTDSKKMILLEGGDEENEAEEYEIDFENLKNRCQKLVKDLNENYEAMRNRYKRSSNHYRFYCIAGLFVANIMSVCSLIDNLFYKTEKSVSTYFEVTRFVLTVMQTVFSVLAIRNDILKEKKLKF